MIDIVKVCKIHGELTQNQVTTYNKKGHKSSKGIIKIYKAHDCKKCTNERSKKYGKKHTEQLRIADKLHYEKTREHHIGLRKIVVLKQFGLTLETYKNLIKKQENKCAICCKEENALNQRKTHVKPLAIDHNHKTGLVRALLCGRCNVGIGMFLESEELLEKARDYLRHHNKDGE